MLWLALHVFDVMWLALHVLDVVFVCNVRLSVRPHLFGGLDLGRGCMDRRQTCST